MKINKLHGNGHKGCAILTSKYAQVTPRWGGGRIIITDRKGIDSED